MRGGLRHRNGCYWLWSWRYGSAHTTAAISRTFCKGLTAFRTTGREGRKNRFKGLGHAAPRPNLRERIQTALAKAEPTEPTLAAPSRTRSNQSPNCPSQAGCQALWGQNAPIKVTIVTIGQSRTRPSDFLTTDRYLQVSGLKVDRTSQ